MDTAHAQLHQWSGSLTALRPGLAATFGLAYPGAVALFALVQAIRLSDELVPRAGFFLLLTAAGVSVAGRLLCKPILTSALAIGATVAIDALAGAALAWQAVLLEYYWGQYFTKDPAHLRTLEHRHQCCGFRTPRDKAVPPNTGKQGTPCHENPALGYGHPCRPVLEEVHQSAQIGLLWFANLLALYHCITVWYHVRRWRTGHGETNALRPGYSRIQEIEESEHITMPVPEPSGPALFPR
ncbi:hypothetical protein IWQ60_007998 [Tieghemiomyces parasiticus]|uniref:Uncharacterized protein n=1 Tax=Tieghemiomyces parasiticus TaxID=78921 RepID=A0A9W7ZUB8_9FUNG|nr:hypothetical protein IWQ60_007998 [Tieghemiomyces parasiticus]